MQRPHCVHFQLSIFNFQLVSETLLSIRLLPGGFCFCGKHLFLPVSVEELAHAAHKVDTDHYSHGYAQEEHVGCLAIEERDDEDSSEVVGNGQCRKKYL